MSPIAISEEDLDRGPGDDSPVVYAPVGGSVHPNVYGPVDPSPEAPLEAGIRPAVLVVAAVVLCATFGIGGLLIGQSGRVSAADRAAERSAEQAKFEADRAAAVKAAVESARVTERARAASRVSAARREGIRIGRASGLRDGREEGLAQGRQEFVPRPDCLTGVSC